jgi:hypothetical protein
MTPHLFPNHHTPLSSGGLSYRWSTCVCLVDKLPYQQAGGRAQMALTTYYCPRYCYLPIV